MTNYLELDKKISALEGKWLPSGLSSTNYERDPNLPRARFYPLPDASVLAISHKETKTGGYTLGVLRTEQKNNAFRLDESRLFQSWQVYLAQWSGAAASHFAEQVEWQVVFDDEGQPGLCWVERSLKPSGYDILAPFLMFKLSTFPSLETASFADISIPFGNLTEHGWDRRVDLSVGEGGVELDAGSARVATYARGEGRVEITHLGSQFTSEQAMAFLHFAQDAVDMGVGQHIGLLQELPIFLTKLLGQFSRQLSR